ncbi:MAG: hypothetical protein LBP99_02430 [Azoarcus sp.]|jgi:hypothetical protein|nr:hypothetical protein [Azoarcus sp.]
MKPTLFAGILWAFIVTAMPSVGVHAANIINAKDVAKNVAKDVGTVKQTSSVVKGVPIIVLDETHTLRVGQIEHAIVLNRLYWDYQLRDIALEGYLLERPDAVDTKWFKETTSGLETIDRARLAGQWLYDGEISAAEFIKLVFDDIKLHPIEVLADRGSELSEAAMGAPSRYLLTIAQLSLKESHRRELEGLRRKLDNAPENQKQAAAQKYVDFILSADPWTAKKDKELTAAMKDLSLEKMLTAIEEIDQRAKQENAPLDADDRKAMAEAQKFWRGRVTASTTMLKNTIRIANGASVKIVAMNVGAAHTDGMVTMLTEQKRPFAVIHPLPMKPANSNDDMGFDAFQRKLKYPPLSVFSEGLMEDLFEIAPKTDKQKKPEPVVNVPWFKKKTQLYTIAYEITKAFEDEKVLGKGSKPPKIPEPPFGLSKDKLTSQYVSVNPNDISIVLDDEKNPQSEEVVLFKAVLNPNDSAMREEIWVKAARVGQYGVVSTTERETVEKILKELLEKAQKDRSPRRTTTEDEKGRIQIDTKNRAVISRTKDAVMKTAVASM